MKFWHMVLITSIIACAWIYASNNVQIVENVLG